MAERASMRQPANSTGKIFSRSGLPNTSLMWVVGVAQWARAAVATIAKVTMMARMRIALMLVLPLWLAL